MTAQAEKLESLSTRARRWRSALTDAATGPLIVASEIVSLADHWEAYKEEAGGLSCASWLQARVTHRGQALDYFAKRHAAVKLLGEACRRTMHHEVAVYVANQVTSEYRDAVKLMLMRECKAQGGPLTMGQATPRIGKIIGRKSRPRSQIQCKRCERLEKALAAAGVALPDWVMVAEKSVSDERAYTRQR